MQRQPPSRPRAALPTSLACLLLAGLLLATGAAVVRPAVAAPVAVTENVTVELIPEVAAAAPGERFWLALRLTIREGWHVYWTNPGDSGLPPVADWQGTDGVSVGDMLFPLPQRIPVGPLVNYGFKNELVLILPVEVGADVPADAPIRLAAQAEWLVCEEICIPEFASLDLELPMTVGPAEPDPSAQTVFAAARAALPRPAPADWLPRFAVADGTVRLHLALPPDFAAGLEHVAFFPAEPGAIVHAADQRVQRRPDGLLLELQGDYLAQEGDLARLDGVLVFAHGAEGEVDRTGYHLSPRPVAADALDGPATGAAATAPGDRGTAGGGDPAWRLDASTALLFAFLGGLLLNLMPCVFPVLFLKAVGMVEHAHHRPWQVRLQGLAFTAGVLVSFLALAGILLGLRAAGSGIGWGFQLQAPAFVAAMAFLFFAIGLSLSGLFSLGGRFAGVGSTLAGRSGTIGAFFTGVLACLVATPCTAPFMGAAVGFAVAQPAAVALAVFAALGLGMALPYLLLSFVPALLRRLPRPGAWMERVKQALAFPMYATAVWLVWVLSLQAGPLGVAAVLSGAVLIAFVAWVHSVTRDGGAVLRAVGTAVVVLGLAGLAGLAGLTQSTAPAGGRAQAAASAPEGGPRWSVYAPERLAALRAEGRPVFLNLTAAWCITCLVNERIALSSEAVGAAFRARNMVALKGDWTSYDPDITKLLAQFGRSGVPLYILYPGNGEEPRVLPQILTEGRVLEAIAAL